METARLIIEAFSAFGELLIAAVIYFEIEAQRASSFLTNVQSADFNNERIKLYEGYVRILPTDNKSLKERADAFKQKLWDDAELREICDRQWNYVYSLRYAVRWSLFHRGVVSNWFPQVLVCLWVMTNRYVRDRESLRPFDIKNYGIEAVRESLRVLKKRARKHGGPADITIWASGKERVTIPKEVLDQMLGNLDVPFK
jgi:hypothetical protein